MGDQRFPRAYRIVRRGDFQRAYQRRCAAADDLLLVFGHRNEGTHARLGLSVSRKVGNAVVRNRWKRRIREAFRQVSDRLPAGMDLIVIPRAAAEPKLDALRGSLLRLAARVARKVVK